MIARYKRTARTFAELELGELAPAARSRSAGGVIYPGCLQSLPFVGRTETLEELDRVLDHARGGAGSVVLIGGEPGIGKTRLARELERRARERGMHALWGSCWEHEGAPAFWPWTQIVRASVRELGSALVPPG